MIYVISYKTIYSKSTNHQLLIRYATLKNMFDHDVLKQMIKTSSIPLMITNKLERTSTVLRAPIGVVVANVMPPSASLPKHV
jgi:hypothetical protein